MNKVFLQSENEYFGEGEFKFGGCFIPEILYPALNDLQNAYKQIFQTKAFKKELKKLLKTFVGRPTPLIYAKNASAILGNKIYLKFEGLANTGAHKINNALAQVLLAKRMKKRHIIAETGAGQHGVAVASVCAFLKMPCTIFMGATDIQRQRPNVFIMEQFGAEVVAVGSGTKTLKDAVNEALRQWSKLPDEYFYVLGSALGPYPYPDIVRDSQSIIGREIKKQIRKALSKHANNLLPDYLIACVGGGSNAIGAFSAFLEDKEVKLIGVEAGGDNFMANKHAMRLSQDCGARIGIVHGFRSYFLQDKHGQIANTHSISAGLDYAGVGPQLAHLAHIERVHFMGASDEMALNALQFFASHEGILPALESSHALAGAIEISKHEQNKVIVVNVSGRGDKDIFITAKALCTKSWRDFLESELQSVEKILKHKNKSQKVMAIDDVKEESNNQSFAELRLALKDISHDEMDVFVSKNEENAKVELDSKAKQALKTLDTIQENFNANVSNNTENLQSTNSNIKQNEESNNLDFNNFIDSSFNNVNQSKTSNNMESKKDSPLSQNNNDLDSKESLENDSLESKNLTLANLDSIEAQTMEKIDFKDDIKEIETPLENIEIQNTKDIEADLEIDRNSHDPLQFLALDSNNIESSIASNNTDNTNKEVLHFLQDKELQNDVETQAHNKISTNDECIETTNKQSKEFTQDLSRDNMSLESLLDSSIIKDNEARELSQDTFKFDKEIVEVNNESKNDIKNKNLENDTLANQLLRELKSLSTQESLKALQTLDTTQEQENFNANASSDFNVSNNAENSQSTNSNITQNEELNDIDSKESLENDSLESKDLTLANLDVEVKETKIVENLDSTDFKDTLELQYKIANVEGKDELAKENSSNTDLQENEKSINNKGFIDNTENNTLANEIISDESVNVNISAFDEMLGLQASDNSIQNNESLDIPDMALNINEIQEDSNMHDSISQKLQCKQDCVVSNEKEYPQDFLQENLTKDNIENIKEQLQESQEIILDLDNNIESTTIFENPTKENKKQESSNLELEAIDTENNHSNEAKNIDLSQDNEANFAIEQDLESINTDLTIDLQQDSIDSKTSKQTLNYVAINQDFTRVFKTDPELSKICGKSLKS